MYTSMAVGVFTLSDALIIIVSRTSLFPYLGLGPHTCLANHAGTLPLRDISSPRAFCFCFLIFETLYPVNKSYYFTVGSDIHCLLFL